MHFYNASLQTIRSATASLLTPTRANLWQLCACEPYATFSLSDSYTSAITGRPPRRIDRAPFIKR